MTQLQTSFPVNMVALVDQVPRTMNLVQSAHGLRRLTRWRSSPGAAQFRLDKAQRRAHIVEGLLKAINVIDAVIALIRASEDRAAAREGLMAEPFEFSEEQAEHILDMRLGQLTRLSRIDLQERARRRCATTIAELEAILADETRKHAVIKDELADIKATFATPRMAQITHDTGDMSIEDLVDDKELVVVMTQAGYVKTIDADAFRTQGRGGRGVAGTRAQRSRTSCRT